MADDLQPNSPSLPEVGVDDAETLNFLRISQGENSTPPSCMIRIWSLTKRCLAAILLLPMRIMCLLIIFLMIMLLYRVSICCCGSSKKAALQCHTAAERLCLSLAYPLWRVALWCAGVTWIRVRRPEGFKMQNITIVGNHVTMLDGPLLEMAFGPITGVALAWTTKVPVAATVASAHHVLAVERERVTSSQSKAKVSPESEAMEKPKSKTDLIVEYQKLSATDPRFLPLLIFPEATTKAPNCLLKFRTGAFVAGEPVQPVAVLWPEDVGWVHSLGHHLLDLMTRWWICVDICVLPPYVPNDDERKNPTLYAQNVQKVIATSMGLKPEQSSLTIGSAELQRVVLQ